MSSSAAPSGSDWQRAATVREDPELRTELARRFTRTSGERPLAVTDLLAPRRAFWRLTRGRVPLPVERQVRLDEGRWLHHVIGSVVAPEGLLEVRVRRGGIVGRIDALTDRPIEVKTTTFAVGPDDLVSDRPDQVEQLGMYCSMVGRATGRLIVVAAHELTIPEVRTVDVRFRSLSSVAAEMERRVAELRSALDRGQAEGLPRCRWYDRGCEFRSGSVCDCTGGEPDPPSLLLEAVTSLESRPEVDRELAERLSKELASLSPPQIYRFRDVIYPRRTYFDRVAPLPAAEEGPPPEMGSVSDLYGRLLETVESGPVGEVTRLPCRSQEPEEEVAAFRGVPYLLRTSRVRSAPRPEEIVGRYPQYVLDLGFRCATTGTRSGRVIVGFEHAESRDDPLKVFAVEFSSVTVFARLFRERLDQLRTALRDRTPSGLEACPGWMFADCPYRTECGCGAKPGRSQR